MKRSSGQRIVVGGDHGNLQWTIKRPCTLSRFRSVSCYRPLDLLKFLSVLVLLCRPHQYLLTIMAIKSVLITGCSEGGIGSALVGSFQKRGLHVFATARTLSKMSHLEKLSNVTLLSLDVTSSSEILAAVEAVRAKTEGTLDYLVNNSGVSYVMPTLDAPIEEAKSIFAVNFWAVLEMTQAFAPLLIAAKGSVVNVSSISGYVHAPWMSESRHRVRLPVPHSLMRTGIYGASKAALTILSETLRLEMAPFDVKVVTVITGVVGTNIMTNVSEIKLPPDSQYWPVEKNIAARARGVDVRKKMRKGAFAEKVVTDVLGGANGKIWRGELASTIRCVPTSFLVSHLHRRCL